MTRIASSAAAYSTIEAAGPDAAEFLQGQLTADIRALAADSAPGLAAWCNPKGRVIALFRLRLADGAYRLALPADLAAAVEKRLAMFRFRSKVEIAVADASADDLGLATGTTLGDWQRAQFRAGIAEICTPQSEQFTPHMLNLDLLDAVSFDKGCYTGQEIVARTHYRGTTKRRMLRFGCDGDAAPGDKVLLEERAVGDVVNVSDSELLAVVPLDAAATGLTVNGSTLTQLDLPYL